MRTVEVQYTFTRKTGLISDADFRGKIVLSRALQPEPFHGLHVAEENLSPGPATVELYTDAEAAVAKFNERQCVTHPILRVLLSGSSSVSPEFLPPHVVYDLVIAVFCPLRRASGYPCPITSGQELQSVDRDRSRRLRKVFAVQAKRCRRGTSRLSVN